MFEEPKAMREVHEIMEKIYEKEKGKGAAEILESIHNSTLNLVQEKGLKLEIVKKKARIPIPV